MKNITIEKIKKLTRKIIIDNQEWVNDSHTETEHHGIVVGLYELIEKLGGNTEDIFKDKDRWYIQ